VTLIGLMIVRNEDWCLEAAVRSALMWCDYVAVYLHSCTDDSSAIVKRLSEETKRISWMTSDDPEWNEMAHRQELLEDARTLNPTHFAIIDADEILCATLLPTIREAIEALPEKTALQVPWIILRGSVHRYHSNGQWGGAWRSIAFKDSPDLHWEGDRFHHTEPFGLTRGVRYSDHEQGGMLHLWGVSERRLRAKQALYKMTERLRWPEKMVVTIDQFYSKWKCPAGELWSFETVPDAWLAGYDVRLINETPAAIWQEGECNRLYALHGAEAFHGLDLFGLPSRGRKLGTPVFSLCHATARFPGWKEAAREWFLKADDPSRVEYLLAIHERDEAEVIEAELPEFGRAAVVVNDQRSCSVDNWNRVARAATGEILINLADDWFPCEHWDTKLLEMIEDISKPVAIDVDTGGSPRLLYFSIITRAYLDDLRTKYGYDGFFFPEYTSMYSDEEFTAIARHDGVVVSARQLFFDHRHPQFGKAKMDDVYRKQNAPQHYAQGKEILTRRLKELNIGAVTQRRFNLVICLPGETFNWMWMNAWTQLYEDLRQLWNVFPVFGYSSNVYASRASMLEAAKMSPVTPDLVLWLDDDNLLSTEQFNQLVQDLNLHPEADGVAGWAWCQRDLLGAVWQPSCGQMVDGIRQPFTHEELSAGRFLEVEYSGFPAFLMRFQSLVKAGESPFRPVLTDDHVSGFYGEDVSFCISSREKGCRWFVDSRVQVDHLKVGLAGPRPTTEVPAPGHREQNTKEKQPNGAVHV
jgi:hypothetical protein